MAQHKHFGREQWLARTIGRRHEEWKEKHADELMKISPSMMQQFRKGQLDSAEYHTAIKAFRKNDGNFTTWQFKNIKRRDPSFNPYKKDPFYHYTYTPKPYKSPSKPATLPPLVNSPSGLMGGGSLPSIKRTFSNVGQAMHDREDDHVDHALEMYRTGHGAGGGAGHSSIQGYLFDGDVAEVGAGDTQPVTEAEVEIAHDIIRDKLKNRFSTFRRAFRTVDENNSGVVSKLEALRILMMLNLTNIREKVMAKLCDIMDKNGNGTVEYNEFCDCKTGLFSNPARPTERYLSTASPRAQQPALLP